MKIIKLKKENSKISRKLVSSFGENIYHSPEVQGVSIKVEFKDGSTVGYYRDESVDKWEEDKEDWEVFRLPSIYKNPLKLIKINF